MDQVGRQDRCGIVRRCGLAAPEPVDQDIPEDDSYHLGTPSTVNSQAAMLRRSGFVSPEMVLRTENTTILLAMKA